MVKPLPSPEVIRQLISYDPHTGKLFWMERGVEWFNDPETDYRRTAKDICSMWNTRYAGREAIYSIDGNGYRSGTIFSVQVKAHRIAWVLSTGAWPSCQIDHVNGVRSDNRLCNLREADYAQNARNCGIRRDNTSGFKGVSRANGKWRAGIKVNGKRLNLGQFDSPEEASQAYLEASKKHHGLFSRSEVA